MEKSVGRNAFWIPAFRHLKTCFNIFMYAFVFFLFKKKHKSVERAVKKICLKMCKSWNLKHFMLWIVDWSHNGIVNYITATSSYLISQILS